MHILRIMVLFGLVSSFLSMNADNTADEKAKQLLLKKIKENNFHIKAACRIMKEGKKFLGEKSVMGISAEEKALLHWNANLFFTFLAERKKLYN